MAPMIATLLAYVLIALLALAVVGLALLPLALFSGAWAWLDAREHRAEARDIERLLAQDLRPSR